MEKPDYFWQEIKKMFKRKRDEDLRKCILPLFLKQAEKDAIMAKADEKGSTASLFCRRIILREINFDSKAVN